MAEPIKVSKPPKPVSEMSDDERRAYAEEVHAAMVAQRKAKQ